MRRYELRGCDDRFKKFSRRSENRITKAITEKTMFAQVLATGR